VLFTGASPDVRRDLLAHGVAPPRVAFAASLEDGLAQARGGLAAAAG
jgi:hypothetical protein